LFYKYGEKKLTTQC